MITYLQENFLNFIEKEKIKTIFELGTRTGEEAECLSEFYAQAIIHGFECNPNVTERAKSKLSSKPNVKFHEIAVSNVNEELTFYPANHMNEGGSSLYVASLGKWWGDLPPIKIQAYRLDDYCDKNKIDPPELICADIQGGEINAFKGMGKYFDHVQYVITEIPTNQPSYHGAPSKSEFLNFMHSKGFKEVAFDVIPTNPYEHNMLFIRNKTP